jgi:DHA1 family multidrug resistance protein B-like MFS transporter
MKAFKQLNRTLKLRILMTFIGVLGYSTVGSSMTIYYNYHLGAAITGVLLIISSVSSFLIGLYGGHLADRHGRRPILLIGASISITGAVIAVLSNSPIFENPWTTFVGFFLLNFGFSFESAADNAMIIDVSDETNRKFVYSMSYWMINVSITFGAALSGWFFRDHLFQLLLGLLLAQLLNASIKYFWISESYVPTQQEKVKKESFFQNYSTVSRDRLFLLFILALILNKVIFGNIDFYLPVHLSESFQTTTIFGFEIYGQRMLTLFLMLNTMLIIFTMTFVNQLTAKWSEKRSLTTGAVLQGIGFSGAFLMNSLLPLIIASIVMTIGEMIIVPASQSLRADLMNKDKIGTYSGFTTITDPIGSVLSGSLVSFSVYIHNTGVAVVMVVITVLLVLSFNKVIDMKNNASVRQVKILDKNA